MIDLGYVAGYFDGEGSVICRKRRWTKITFCNTHKQSLREIQEFLRAGRICEIHKRHSSLGRKRMYVLTIGRGQDLRRILPQLIPMTIIKRRKLENLLKVVLTKGFRVTPYEWWKKIDFPLLVNRYRAESGSMTALAKQYDVSTTAIRKLLIRKGIKRKSMGGRRGKIILPLQRLELSRIKRKFWSNRKNRLRMSAAMKAGWKRRQVA